MKFSAHDSTERTHATHEPRRDTPSPGESAAPPSPGGTPPAASETDTYAPPHLLVYGVVRDLTASGGRFGKNDKAVRHSRTGF